MDLKGKNAVVVGMARSGLAVARFLGERGASVTITDQAPQAALGAFWDQARALNVGLEPGGHRPATFEAADLVVLSPGVPHTMGLLQRVRRGGVPVIGEIELASRFIKTPIVAVSGTNGKTTTTELLGRMLAASGRKVFVGGNIGNPLIDIAGRDADLDVIVAEISSFQLDTAETFKPRVAVLLNITPDHLDRYADMEAYIASKGRLFMNQDAGDIAVCNGNDANVTQICRNVASRMLHFYVVPPNNGHGGPGAIITPRQVAICLPPLAQGRVDLRRAALIGPHNRENIAAASLAALSAGATMTGIQEALDDFQALSHRLEPVGSRRGVNFVNDSKATNVDAVMRALECFDRPVVLIMGGRNKGYDFNRLRNHVQRHVRRLIVIGEAADEIMACLAQVPPDGAEQAGTMADAVQRGYAAAREGDTVLLSPACASFDMFGSYAERGDTFRRLVGELA